MNNRYSGCSAVGSASGLGPGGRRFESCHPDKNLSKFYGFERFFLSCLLCLFGCLIPIRMHTSEGILMYKSTEYREQRTEYRVLGDNKTLFCHFERRREISELRPLVHLTLRLLLCVLFIVVLSCSFGAQKNEKARHTGKTVCRAFAHNLQAKFFGRLLC